MAFLGLMLLLKLLRVTNATTRAGAGVEDEVLRDMRS